MWNVFEWIIGDVGVSFLFFGLKVWLSVGIVILWICGLGYLWGYWSSLYLVKIKRCGCFCELFGGWFCFYLLFLLWFFIFWVCDDVLMMYFLLCVDDVEFCIVVFMLKVIVLFVCVVLGYVGYVCIGNCVYLCGV